MLHCSWSWSFQQAEVNITEISDCYGQPHFEKLHNIRELSDLLRDGNGMLFHLLQQTVVLRYTPQKDGHQLVVYSLGMHETEINQKW